VLTVFAQILIANIFRSIVIVVGFLFLLLLGILLLAALAANAPKSTQIIDADHSAIT
jgi:hypothetical protein